MADEVTLRECPHCGYAPYLKSFEYRGFGGMGYWVTCTHCGNRTWETDTPEKAVAAWNTRVPDPALAVKDARIAELEAEIAALKGMFYTCADCFNYLKNGKCGVYGKYFDPTVPVRLKCGEVCGNFWLLNEEES